MRFSSSSTFLKFSHPVTVILSLHTSTVAPVPFFYPQVAYIAVEYSTHYARSFLWSSTFAAVHSRGDQATPPAPPCPHRSVSAIGDCKSTPLYGGVTTTGSQRREMGSINNDSHRSRAWLPPPRESETLERMIPLDSKSRPRPLSVGNEDRRRLLRRP